MNNINTKNIALTYFRYSKIDELNVQHITVCEKAESLGLTIERKFYDRKTDEEDALSYSGFYDLIETNRFFGGVSIVISHPGALDNVPEPLVEAIAKDGGRWVVCSNDAPSIPQALIYIRTGNNSSILNQKNSQIEICETYAFRKGWGISKVFCDLGVSGTQEIRPGLSELLTELAKGDNGTPVIVSDVSRISRSITLLNLLKKKIKELGGTLFVVSQHRPLLIDENISSQLKEIENDDVKLIFFDLDWLKNKISSFFK